jgi:hypothetical protein
MDTDSHGRSEDMFASPSYGDEHATCRAFKRVRNLECVFCALECLFRFFGNAPDRTPAEQVVSPEERHFDVETLTVHVVRPTYQA